jgi:hypothetical protein
MVNSDSCQDRNIQLKVRGKVRAGAEVVRAVRIKDSRAKRRAAETVKVGQAGIQTAVVRSQGRAQADAVVAAEHKILDAYSDVRKGFAFPAAEFIYFLSEAGLNTV